MQALATLTAFQKFNDPLLSYTLHFLCDCGNLLQQSEERVNHKESFSNTEVYNQEDEQ